MEAYNPPPDPRPADYMRLARQIEADTDSRLEDLRVAFLSSYSLSFVEPFLVVESARRGLRVRPYFGGFGQFEQEIAGEGSKLRGFDPEVLVLALRPEDLDPDAVHRYHASRGERYARLVDDLVVRLGNLIRMFRTWSDSPVLVANFAPPSHPPFGLFDANLGGSLTYAVAIANRRLRERVDAEAGAIVWDWAGLIRSCGASDWTDPRLWALARIPVTAGNQPRLARHLARALCALCWRPAKCLVLDLDNTLWGGVVGDDGIEGIQLGDDYPGNVYKSLQRSALNLMDRGILLAVVSKNEREVVEQVFREHPEMLIRWDQLAGVRVNWRPKSQNIRELADELNIGSDSMVLFDDNPVERAEVRANAPEVGVVEVPEDPLRFVTALAESHHFDQIDLSPEDFERNAMYRAERERRAFTRTFETVEDFLQNLDMEAEVGELNDSTLNRVAQLVNRTNQFNLTTRRYTATELEALRSDPAWLPVWLRVRDRFGDQGLVAVGILEFQNDTARADTVLMSCRVMNRHVEDALMAYLMEQAREKGCSRLIGEYLPTRKNTVVRDFYPRFGFREMGRIGDEGRRYVLDLERQVVEWPEFIQRVDAHRVPAR